MTPRGIAGEKKPPSRTKACRRRLPASARASLPLSAAPDARRWAPKARGRKTKRTLPRPEGPPPLGRASLHGWEPHLTRDGTPLPLAGSPRAEGFPSTVRGGQAWERRRGPRCVRWGKPTLFLRQGGPGAQRERGPGPCVVSACRAAACACVGSCGGAAQGPPQAEHTGHGARGGL